MFTGKNINSLIAEYFSNFRCAFRYTLFVFATAAVLASCTSESRITRSTTATSIDTSSFQVLKVRRWLMSRAAAAQSLMVNGTVTVDHDGSTNSGSFTLKNKRLDLSGEHRVDSLSIEIQGPFGIKVARFLASPDRYQFSDILHGDTRSGSTDPKSLEALTHLNGVTLSMMSDLLYGLAPQQDDFLPQDSTALYSSGNRHTLVIYRLGQRCTETIDMAGDLSDGSVIAPDALTITKYQRWNGIITDPVASKLTPAVSVQYTNPTIVSGIEMPKRIDATAGENSLTLEYDDVHLNPNPLIVHIKMPE